MGEDDVQVGVLEGVVGEGDGGGEVWCLVEALGNAE